MYELRQKILIIDDIPSNILILSDLLDSDYEIYFATSGAVGLEIASHEMPDLILLDIMMPEMDGYEVCKKLKEEPKTRDIPVIFVTAMGEVEDEEKGILSGAIDYIVKPVSPPILRARVKNHLELKRYRDILENLSFFDGLTGLANRRRFDEVLKSEWTRACRRQEALSLIMLDIDFFKKYNDTYGHLAGDECLRQMGKLLQEAVKRVGDLPARYGGEEFSIILPLTDAPSALKLAENMRSMIEAKKVLHEKFAVSEFVTVSIGVATMIPEKGVPATILIEKADQALYQAKRTGRNKVVQAEAI